MSDKPLHTLEATAVLLFLLQAVRVLFPVLFGIIYDVVFGGTAAFYNLVFIGDASPAVLGGDFNATPDSPVYARIQAAGFKDPFIVGGFDPALTDPAIEPQWRIDFVWMRGMGEVRDAQMLDSLASDHRMVVVELTLP